MLIILCCNVVLGVGYKNVIDRVTELVVKNSRAYRITLILDSATDSVSMKSSRIAHGILATTPCLVIDVRLLKSNESEDGNVVLTRSLISRRLEHRVIKVLIIDNVGEILQKEESSNNKSKISSIHRKHFFQSEWKSR